MTNKPTAAAELASLRATIEAHIKTVERDRTEARDQRDTIAKDIHDIKNNAVSIDNRVTNIESDVAVMKPTVKKITGWEQRALGGLVVLGMLGTAVTMFWDAVREKIVEVFTGV